MATHKNSQGFTLMELIGVMAILAILAGALAPNIFRAIDDAVAASELQNLERLAEDLEHYILTNKAIPSSSVNNWSTELASVSEYPAEDIRLNQNGHQRAIFFDPRFFSTSDTNFGGFTQTNGISSGPNSARLMIISDTKGGLPSLSASTSVFDAIWNQDTGAVITETSSLKILRLNIGDLFQRIILTNPNTSQTSYALESGGLNPVPAASGSTDGIAEFWVIEGTELRLFSPPFPSGSLATVELVDSHFSYRFIDLSP